jgi:hypothetical protein
MRTTWASPSPDDSWTTHSGSRRKRRPMVSESISDHRTQIETVRQIAFVQKWS